MVGDCHSEGWAHSQTILWRKVLCAVSDPPLSSWGWMHKQGGRGGTNHIRHTQGPLFPSGTILDSSQIQFCWLNEHQTIWAYCVPGQRGCRQAEFHRYQACLARSAIASAEPSTFTTSDPWAVLLCSKTYPRPSSRGLSCAKVSVPEQRQTTWSVFCYLGSSISSGVVWEVEEGTNT